MPCFCLESECFGFVYSGKAKQADKNKFLQQKNYLVCSRLNQVMGKCYELDCEKEGLKVELFQCKSRIKMLEGVISQPLRSTSNDTQSSVNVRGVDICLSEASLNSTGLFKSLSEMRHKAMVVADFINTIGPDDIFITRTGSAFTKCPICMQDFYVQATKESVKLYYILRHMVVSHAPIAKLFETMLPKDLFERLANKLEGVL